ncbi:MAG: MFS transporter [Chloroflexi bacterium]|nr:MFS transporter [Chloroflexota bacterium]
MRRLDAYKVYLTTESAAALFFSMIVAANMIYQVTAVGLNPLQLVLVGTVLEATAFIFEVPTGIVADVYSRRLSIIIGYLLIGVGFALEGLVPRFEAILLAQVIWGIGYTFTSGASEAWIADEIGEARVGGAFVRAAQGAQVGAVIGTIVGIALGSVQINLPIVLGGVLTSAIGVWLIVCMPERGFMPKPRGERTSFQHMAATLRDGIGMMQRRPALLTILAVTAVDGIASEGYDRLWTAHVLDNFTFPDVFNLQPIVWLGAIRIAIMLLSALGLEAVRRRVQPNNHRSSARALFVLYAGLALSMLAVALSGGFALLVIVSLAVGVLRRMIGPLYTAWVNQRLDPQVRATVISMSSQANALGQIAGGPVVGVIGAAWSIRAALVASAALLTPVLWLVRHTALNHERTAVAASEVELA